MDILVDSVKELVSQEYWRATEKFGCINTSDHQSFGVILEEMQESEAECGHAGKHLQEFWDLVKTDGPDIDKKVALKRLTNSAVLAAAEWIQVAATAHKAWLTINNRSEPK